VKKPVVETITSSTEGFTVCTTFNPSYPSNHQGASGRTVNVKEAVVCLSTIAAEE
jgi:hypothetical protein